MGGPHLITPYQRRFGVVLYHELLSTFGIRPTPVTDQRLRSGWRWPDPPSEQPPAKTGEET